MIYRGGENQVKKTASAQIWSRNREGKEGKERVSFVRLQTTTLFFERLLLFFLSPLHPSLSSRIAKALALQPLLPCLSLPPTTSSSTPLPEVLPSPLLLLPRRTETPTNLQGKVLEVPTNPEPTSSTPQLEPPSLLNVTLQLLQLLPNEFDLPRRSRRNDPSPSRTTSTRTIS